MIVARSSIASDVHFQPTITPPESDDRRFYKYLRRYNPTAKNLEVSLRKAFHDASKKVPAISSVSGVLGGSPCLRGTRVPVYMILDAVEYYGTLKGVQRSYPRLSREQVRDAVRFAKLVLESPLDDKASNFD